MKYVGCSGPDAESQEDGEADGDHGVAQPHEDVGADEGVEGGAAAVRTAARSFHPPPNIPPPRYMALRAEGPRK